MDNGWVGSSDSQRAVPRATRQPTPWDEVQAARKRAWAALESDFRARIASGEVVLTGLQIAPTLARSRSRVPAGWAPLMRFKVSANIVIAKDATIIGVTASQSDSAADATPNASVANETAESDIPSVVRHSRRECYAPLIEEALRARWDDVAARVSSDEGFIATHIAKMLEAWIKSTYPERVNKHLPASGTIRTRVRKIYDRLLAEKAVR